MMKNIVFSDVELTGYKFYHNLPDRFPVIKHLDGFWFFTI